MFCPNLFFLTFSAQKGDSLCTAVNSLSMREVEGLYPDSSVLLVVFFVRPTVLIQSPSFFWTSFELNLYREVFSLFYNLSF